MKIDLETVRFYCGLGDIVMWAWLAEGSKYGPDPITFYRKRDRELLDLLGLTADDEPGGINLDPVFDTELRERGLRSRIDYIRSFLNVTTPLVRPTLRIAPEVEKWADEKARELGDPLIMLFPQTAWVTREWPANYWVDLAWKLKAAGGRPLVLMQGEDARFKNTPVYWWGFPVPNLAALMKRAALVVGNDSFPAHLAGTVGVPTLALMGPTRRTVFGYSPDVVCLGSSRIECTGCHFQAPFRAACDQGCLSLYRLFPEDVFASVAHLLRSRRAARPLSVGEKEASRPA
jgi:hypothetical protein